MTKEILVVDDQPAIRMLLQEVLKGEGYEVALAETGKEALDKVYAGSYDLLILDYKLPVVDGVQVLRQLENDQVPLPAIVMSGLAEEVRTESLQFNLVKEVFAKPFNIQEISGFVQKVI
ncbi:response regulator [Lentibacillus amyloliquefaciens]|uniref:Stage 0 sporulation protein F n=1 Tax=Lentibacillus amyloliquefaciens TaxID=1472767 RepID=A0A0U4FH96_9BACI|nr:response regulator [Lentibacillus amyloliquefaciens]ALX49869.1 stage 0 sporulation protein F [Lentibacillus amyloliquefaciens]